MKSYTIDASVALKWVSHEKEFNLETAKQIFISGVQRKIALIAPTLLKAEVANILLKKKKLTVANTKKALEIIKKANVIFTELNDPLIKISLKFAKKYDLSVYDGIYLAVSQLSRSPLISDDEKGHGKIKEVLLLKSIKAGQTGK